MFHLSTVFTTFTSLVSGALGATPWLQSEFLQVASRWNNWCCDPGRMRIWRDPRRMDGVYLGMRRSFLGESSTQLRNPSSQRIPHRLLEVGKPMSPQHQCRALFSEGIIRWSWVWVQERIYCSTSEYIDHMCLPWQLACWCSSSNSCFFPFFGRWTNPRIIAVQLYQAHGNVVMLVRILEYYIVICKFQTFPSWVTTPYHGFLLVADDSPFMGKKQLSQLWPGWMRALRRPPQEPWFFGGHLGG